ncbi:hypothetical protein BGLT_02945 [Caballeronia glathei]|nr:hypothetical protein BGLT_02945 [Caballeronia glathei]
MLKECLSVHAPVIARAAYGFALHAIELHSLNIL